MKKFISFFLTLLLVFNLGSLNFASAYTKTDDSKIEYSKLTTQTGDIIELESFTFNGKQVKYERIERSNGMIESTIVYDGEITKGTFNRNTKEITLNGKYIDYDSAEEMAKAFTFTDNQSMHITSDGDWEFYSSSQGNAKIDYYTAAGLALVMSYLVPIPINVLLGLCSFIETIEASELTDDRIYYKRYTYLNDTSAPVPYPFYYKHVIEWYSDSSYSERVATETSYEFPILP